MANHFEFINVKRLFSSSGILVLLTLISLFFYQNGYAQSEITLKSIHIVTPSWNNVTNEDGTGLYFDIVRKVYQPLKIDLVYQIVPWKRAIKMIKYHAADAMLGGYYVFREGVEDLFPKYPIGGETLAALSKRGRVRIWEGQKSLAGKKVAWIRNYNYQKHLDVVVDWIEIDNEKQGWNLVDKDKIDFHFDSLNILNNYIKAMNVDTEKYDVNIVFNKPLFMRFSNTIKSKKLIEIYDSRMPELINSGEIKTLFAKWNFPYPPLDPRESTP